MVTVQAQRMREAADVQLEYLEKLGDELARRGLQVRMVLPPGRVPSLYVVNPEARGLQRLYVALTRAVSRLTVLHAEPLPEALSKA